MKRSWFVLAMIFVAAACSRSERGDENVMGTETTTTVVYATTNCTVKNPTGTEGVDYCNEKTCKKDATSNCEQFAGACLKTGHSYSGTADEGTCTRKQS